MLDRVRMSACKPAPPLGSAAAKVSTIGGEAGIRASRKASGEGLFRGEVIRLEFEFYSNSPSPLRCSMNDTRAYRTYMCLICGFIYDEAAGLPEEGIPPGTRWEDVPMNWTCPECGARKEDFEMVEI